MLNQKKSIIYFSTHNTLFGRMNFASSENGLCLAEFVDNNIIDKPNLYLKKIFGDVEIVKDEERNIEAVTQLKEYFNGSRKIFDIKFDLIGTPFRKRVWEILSNIEYGELWTYKDVAKVLGDVKKCRAVGGAIGKNPIAVFIP